MLVAVPPKLRMDGLWLVVEPYKLYNNSILNNGQNDRVTSSGRDAVADSGICFGSDRSPSKCTSDAHIKNV